MDRTELLKSPEYWTQHIQLSLFGMVNDYLSRTGTTRTEFARSLGVSKGYVSQILNGDYDHKLSKFVELAMACGYVPDISYIPTDAVISNDAKILRTKSYLQNASYQKGVLYRSGISRVCDKTTFVSDKSNNPFLRVA